MIRMPETPNVPGRGLRQQRAAQLKAELASRSRQRQAATSPEGNQCAPEETERPQAEAVAEDVQEQSVGPVGTGDHLVRQGECISSIAKDVGHFWETIWEHAANAELRDVRKDPNILLPDDRVVIPEKRKKQEPGETEMRHRFVRRGEPAVLRLQVFEDGEPRANEPYTIEIDGHQFTGTTDADGNLQCPIPANAKRGRVVVGADQEEYDVVLGAIDPIHETTGVQGRLNNLNFNCGPVDGVLGSRTRSALRSFQESSGLQPTGNLDEPTRSHLLKVHGS